MSLRPCIGDILPLPSEQDFKDFDRCEVDEVEDGRLRALQPAQPGQAVCSGGPDGCFPTRRAAVWRWAEACCWPVYWAAFRP